MRFKDRNAWWFRLFRAVEMPFTRLFPDHPTVNWAISQITYRVDSKAFANVKAPRRFSEYLMRDKLSPSGRDPLRAATTCKYSVKSHISAAIGEAYAVPTLALLKTEKELADFVFPTPCVVKPTHHSGEVIFLKDRQPTLIERKRMRRWLFLNYFYMSREPNYKPLAGMIIVEPFLTVDGKPPSDVKVFCFHGRPKFFQVDMDRQGGHRRVFYDLDGEQLPLSRLYPVVEVPCAYRDRIAEITEIAAKLSAPFPFLSVDLYVLPDRIHVGEMSHFIGSCAVPFKPDAADEMIADLFNNPDAPITAARLRSAA